MPITMIGDRPIEVNDEGFLTKPEQWDDQLGETLAGLIDMDLTDQHRAVLKFLREDYSQRKETATLRRVVNVGGFNMKELFTLFPGKPAKKMSWLAGLPKPKGCV